MPGLASYEDYKINAGVDTILLDLCSILRIYNQKTTRGELEPDNSNDTFVGENDMELLNRAVPRSSSQQAFVRELAAIVGPFSPNHGEHRVAIPSLTFYRYSAPSKEESTFGRVTLFFAAQGAKPVTAGDTSYHYGTEHYLVTSIDMPVIGRVIEGYHLDFAGAEVTFLVRPHRKEALDRPQTLNYLDDKPSRFIEE